jgi:hypothetical protein
VAVVGLLTGRGGRVEIAGVRALRIGLLALSVVACARPIEADLLDVRGVSPDRVQPGHRVSVRGSGFPSGRDAQVRFAGVLHRPGLAARAVDVELDGDAVADDRVEVAIPAAALRRFGGRGTFRGTVTVSFGADAIDEGRVVGSLADVAIDLVPAEALTAVDRTFAPRVGLELAPREDDEPGVLVTRVAGGSRAAQAGLVEGDRIVALGGLRLLSRDELAPPPDVAAIELSVAREGEAGTFAVLLPLDGLDESVPRASIVIAQLAVLVWLGALLLLGPGAALVDRLAPSSRRVPYVLAIAALGGSIALREALVAVPLIGLDSVVLAIVAGRGAVVLLAARGARERVDAIARGVTAVVAALCALGVASIATGTTELAALEAGQGPWPSDWIALRSPSGPVAAVLVALAAACGPRVVEERSRVRALDDVFLIALATCAIIALAGGASARGAIEVVRPGVAWLGTVAFAGMAALVVVVLRRARDRGARARTSVLVAAGVVLSALATIGALGWIELEVPRAIERAIAEVLVVAAALVVVRLATARPPAPARPLNPLL